MSKHIIRIAVPLEFRAGLMPGAGAISNQNFISLDGMGKPVLHGTSIAGVLRSAFRKIAPENENFWFGRKLERYDDRSDDSRLKIADTVLDCGKADVAIRMHNSIIRHTGATVAGGLFSMEALPPGTRGTILLEIDCKNCESEKSTSIISTLAGLFETGLFFGGSRNRGIGLATAPQGLFVERYDVSTAEGYAALLDSRYNGRRGSKEFKGNPVRGTSAAEFFKLNLIMGIPRGEDLLVGDGQTMDYVLEPQKVHDASGVERWRIPGSALRGIFRAWMTRLAAREGKVIRDSFKRFDSDEEHGIPPRDLEDYKGDSPGWAFIDKQGRKTYQDNPELLNDPILSLFGSCYAKGRIHFADALSTTEIAETDAAARKHVSIDRFSGGANEGGLFENKVLKNSRLEFPVAMQIEKPGEREILWLTRTLKALHLGVISIGSSKSSGRLAIKTIIHCSYPETKAELQKFLEAHP
jgi:CRISPR/Cas system CSM-associated protein Csm3 (group 7 of RAMP superfamily)